MTVPVSRALLRALIPALLLLLAACTTGGDGPTEPGEPAEDDATADADTRLDANPTGCVDDAADSVDHFPDTVTFEHAGTVDIAYHDTYKVLDVALPFDDATARYVLVQCGTEPPALEGDLADASVIEVPVTAAVTMTTTNLPHFDALDAVDRVAGVGVPDFVSTASVLEAIEAGRVERFGDAEGSPDIERLIAAQPDVAVLDAFGSDVLDTAARLDEGDVPVLLNTDFRETTLLGRAEWLKVTAALLNAEAAATERFAEIEEAYREVAALVADVEERPRVLNGMPFEGTWFAPGGRSVTAQAIADAGGAYVFADDESTESVAFDLETVLDRGADADVWIAAGSVHGTLDDLRATDERFAEIEAFGNGRVWAGDAATTPQGGNARFESAYLRADLFLADLAAMFHPDLVDHEPVYYGPVPEG